MSEKLGGEAIQNDPLNEIFSGPSDERDLSEMVARDGKPLFTRLTAILGLAALFLAGIIVGAHFQSQNVSATGSSAAAGASRNAFAGQGSRGAGAASAFGGGAGGLAGGLGTPVAAGQIKLIDGTNIYVTTESGSVVKVATDNTTRIRKSATLTIGQLKIGDTVTVSGQNGADGTVSATSINVGGLPGGVGGTATGGASQKSASPTPSVSTSKSPKPSVSTSGGASIPRANRSAALIACLQKKGIKVDPTKGTRALRNSTDPKVQAAFAACRTSAFPAGGTSPTP
jgi:hypothetical protein